MSFWLKVFGRGFESHRLHQVFDYISIIKKIFFRYGYGCELILIRISSFFVRYMVGILLGV
jgi:hypothetical protein